MRTGLILTLILAATMMLMAGASEDGGGHRAPRMVAGPGTAEAPGNDGYAGDDMGGGEYNTIDCSWPNPC